MNSSSRVSQVLDMDNAPGLAIELDVVLDLLSGPNSHELVERHLNALARLCWTNRDGFSIRDLQKVLNVLEITMGLFERHQDPRFEEALSGLIRVLSRPFIKKSATDEVKGVTNITAILQRVGDILENAALSTPLRIEAAKMFDGFACGYQTEAVAPPGALEPPRPPSPRQYLQNQTILLRSDVVAMVVRAFFEAPDELKPLLVSVCLTMSHSTDLAARMVECGIFEHLPAILAGGGIRDPITPQTAELAWNLLDAVPETRLSDGVACDLARALMQLFEAARDGGFRDQDKELRNDLMVLVLLLSRRNVHQEAFYRFGVSAYVAECACHPELESHEGDPSPFGRGPAGTSPPDSHDQQLRELSWSSLAQLVRHEATLSLALRRGFLDCVMRHADPERDPPLAAMWSPFQLAALTKAAPSILLEVAPLCLEDFYQQGGADLLVALIRTTRDREVLRMVLGLTWTSAAEHEGMRQQLGQSGMMAAIVDLMHDDELATEPVRHVTMLSISVLTAANKVNQDLLRKADGVPLLQAELQRVCQGDHSLPSPYVVSVVDALWSAIARSRKSLARFLLFDGMEWLLYLVEVAHETVQPIALSVLADVLRNPRAKDYLVSWVSRSTKRPAVRMLLDLWRSREEKRPLVPEPGPVPTLPTASAGSPTLKRSSARLGATMGTGGGGITGTAMYTLLDPKRIDLVNNFRQLSSAEATLAKLYSVLQNVGFDALADGLGGDLSTEDRATLSVVRNYVRLLQGEIWVRISERFESEGFRPTGVDAARLAGALATYADVAREVRADQGAVEESERREIVRQEQQFYADLMAQREAERTARHYKKAQHGVSLKQRMEAKKRKEAMLKGSLRHPDAVQSLSSFHGERVGSTTGVGGGQGSLLSSMASVSSIAASAASAAQLVSAHSVSQAVA